MLVMLTETQVMSPHQVCQGCLFANRAGFPRWNSGQLGCGHCLGKSGEDQPLIYQCEMGFRLVNIE